MALSGKLPFIHSFAVFVSGRSYDQIRQAICTARLNVKIVGSSAGLSDFGDGATHQSIEDMALMRALPQMTVLSPCDAYEVKKAVWAMAEREGPVYLRLSRNDVPWVTEADTPFEIGRIQQFRPGKDRWFLRREPWSRPPWKRGANLRHAASPPNRQCRDAQTAGRSRHPTRKPRHARVVTVEEHTVIGGLGSAVLEALSGARVPVRRIGIRDAFGTSGMNHAELLEHYGLTATAVVGAARELMEGRTAA